jgi:hypothetical protein
MKMIRIATIIIGVVSILLSFSSCGDKPANSVEPLSNSNDERLVGKWVRKGRYYLTLRQDGKGIWSKGSAVNSEDIPSNIFKEGKGAVNWVTHNHNFLTINTDEKLLGFSYQLFGDSLVIKNPSDRPELFLRVVDKSEPDEQ